MKKKFFKHRKIAVIFSGVFILMLVNNCQADKRYSVATGNWNSTSTWSETEGGPPGASVPGAADSVIFGSDNGLTVTVTANASCAYLHVYPPNTNGTKNILFINNGVELIVNGNVHIEGDEVNGSNKKAEIILNGGILTVSDSLMIGCHSSGFHAHLDLANEIDAASTLNLNGAFFSPTGKGHFHPGANSTVNFMSSISGQTITFDAVITQYANVTINNTYPDGAVIDQNITSGEITGDLLVQSGKFNNAGYSISGAAGKTFEVANSAAYELKGVSAFPTGFNLSDWFCKHYHLRWCRPNHQFP